MGYSRRRFHYSRDREEWAPLWRHPFVVAPAVLFGLILSFIAGQTVEQRASAGTAEEVKAMMPRLEVETGGPPTELESFIGFGAPLWEAQFAWEFPAGGWYRFAPSAAEGSGIRRIEVQADLSAAESYLEIGFGVDDRAWLNKAHGFYALRFEGDRILLVYAVTGKDRVVVREFTSAPGLAGTEIALEQVPGGIRIESGGVAEVVELPAGMAGAPISLRTNLLPGSLNGLAVHLGADGAVKEYRMM